MPTVDELRAAMPCERPDIIFDFDGTLADSMGVWEKIDIDFFKKYNLPLTQEVCESFVVMGFEAGAHYTRTVLGLDKEEQDIIDEWNQMAEDYYAKDIFLKPGVFELLTYLHEQGVNMAICTSNHMGLLMPCLKNNGIDGFFDIIVCSNDLQVDKTVPDAFVHTAQLMGADPARTLVFEDTGKCAAAAKKAGFTTVGLLDEHIHQSKEELAAACDLLLGGFEELAPGTEACRAIFGV